MNLLLHEEILKEMDEDCALLEVVLIKHGKDSNNNVV